MDICGALFVFNNAGLLAAWDIMLLVSPSEGTAVRVPWTMLNFGNGEVIFSDEGTKIKFTANSKGKTQIVSVKSRSNVLYAFTP